MGIDPAALDPQRDLCEETRELFYPLVECFGEEHAKRVIACLIQAVGGGRYYINAAQPLVEQQRATAALALLGNGHSTREVSRRTGLQHRQVTRLQRRMVE